MNKICSKCKQEKDVSEFGKRSNTKDGFRHNCKQCEKQYSQRPEIKEMRNQSQKLRSKLPENKEKRKRYEENYNQLPEVKDRHKKYKQTLDYKFYNREYSLRRKYNLTQEQYNQMFVDQNGVCAICGKPETIINFLTKKTQLLCVDHDHNTGRTRELLCHNCNIALGSVKEDSSIAFKLVEYIIKHKGTDNA